MQERYSEEVKSILEAAQQQAVMNYQQELSCAHILVALSSSEGFFRFLLANVKADERNFAQEAKALMQRIPSVKGQDRQLVMSTALARVLGLAAQAAGQGEVNVGNLVAALAGDGDSETVSLLKKYGIDKKKVEGLYMAYTNGQADEESKQTLEKYGQEQLLRYYDELNDEEKDAVTKVIRTLLRQTFILERKYDKKSGRLTYNKEFRTVDLHQEFLREYFKISGITLRENLHLGVFYIEGETVIGEKISRLSTIYLLILKLLYDEHMAEASSNTSVYTSLGEIHEKINDFHLMNTLPSITEMRRSIALLKRYQIIEPLDVLEELNEETRMMIYPCVNVVLLGDDIRRLIESFSKEGIDSEFSEDESAVFGTIEDMPE